MVLGSKTQSTNVENLEGGSVWGSVWIGGTTADLLFLAADGYPRAVFCNVTGIAKLKDHSDPVVETAFNLVAGQTYPLRPSQFTSSGSTAELIPIW